MFTQRQKEGLLAIAFAVGGLALIIRALTHFSNWKVMGRLEGQVGRLGRLGDAGVPTESMAQALKRTAGVITKVTPYAVTDIKDRVRLIANLAVKDYTKPEIREAALGALTRKTTDGEWATEPKNWRAEVEALFALATDPRSPYAVRYTMDPVGVDLYTAPSKTQKLKGEDCDGLVAYYAALLMSVGYRPMLVTMATPKSPNGDFSHILLIVPKPNQSTDGSVTGGGELGEFIVTDPSESERGFGWEPPGLTDSIRYGRPFGIVSKLKVYKIV